MRDSPYATENRASAQRAMLERAEPPSSLRLLVRWFTARYRVEVPDAIHSGGVESERPGRIVRADGEGVTDPGGGSRLGAPRLSPHFRAYLFGSPFATEHPESEGRPEIGESYASPMRATIAWIEHRHPLRAAWLRAIGRTDGDWQTVTYAADLPMEYGEAITFDALRLAWHHYEEGPTSR